MDSLLRYDNKAKYCFVDLETFNLNLSFCHNRPWQYGMLKVVGDKQIESKDLRVKWKSHLRIGAGAAKVTNFNQVRHDRLAIPEAEAFEIMYEWLEWGDYIVGHNLLGFDLPLIKEHCLMHSKPWKNLAEKIIDTKCLAFGLKAEAFFNREEESLADYQLRISDGVRKGLKTNLQLCGKERGIEHDYENLHDALVDLELNLKIWNKMKWEVEI
jgi:DNA polymerase III epsilon subunit-like protein